MKTYVSRGKTFGKQYLKGVLYWEQISHRAISIFTFLGKRGLGFRGSNEIVGSNDNGNFLGLLDLVPEYSLL
ncbi:hypothetical protein PR048_005988 [Dryococelus australis]|uniref:Uncharacterized protein n=1 Tax=Dryococelus australis TaxID=614101 RepID=A0ABQ9I9R3_9NEOP|nr:hypothetical protein PR048_005988 [Dryococelus australis]